LKIYTSILFAFFLITPLYAEKLFLIKFGVSEYPSELTNRKSSTKVKLGWYFYYYEKEPYKILIDSGTTNASLIRHFKIQSYQKPEDLLLKKGIHSDSITDIFITHSHFDHIEGILAFPNAKLHIQEKEYGKLKTTSFYSQKKQYFLNRENDHLLYLYKGDAIVYGIVHLIPTFGHTIGSQAVEIHTESSHLLFTGDECYFVEECKKGQGTFLKALYSEKQNSLFMEKVIQSQINSKVKILTFHDPELENEVETIR
jgi:N-acyl homoserine lactone hydrolase